MRLAVPLTTLATVASVAALAPALASADAPGGTAAAEPTAGSTAPATGGSAPTGTSAPVAGATGGNGYGRRFRIPPVIRSFTATPRSVVFGGPPTTLRFRIDAVNLRSVRVRLTIRRAGGAASLLSLGRRRTGRTAIYRWARAGISPGTYTLSLAPVDTRGRALARAARATVTVRVRPVVEPAPQPAPAPGESGAFPIAGSYTWGDGFGVDRGDHKHNGQDLSAAAGTPLVSPRNGTVYATGYGGGSGEYVVVKDATVDRSYVFFHLLRGSTAVSEGQTVRAGQRIGLVGSTGHSTGPHLHFELWVGGWWSGGHAIDPAPTLRSWES